MNFHKATVTTFSKTNKRELFKAPDTPGPGRYKAETVVTDPKHTFKFGNESKFKQPSSNNPGVGSYEVIPTNSSTPKITFSKTPRKNELFINNSTKVNIETLSTIPGPGRYNDSNGIKLTKKNAPNYSISGKSRDEPVNINPGPGQYELSKSSSNIKNNNGTLSKSKRDFKFSTTAHTSITLAINDETPGPGRYSTDSSIKDKVKKFKLGTSKRELTKPLNDFPGPGDYAVENVKTIENNNKKGGFSISKAKRVSAFVGDKSKDEEIPGPGRYNTLSDFNQKKVKGFTFTSKDNTIDVQKVPGPGQYELSKDTIKAKSPGGKLSLSVRNDVFETPKSKGETPGPGRYSSSISYSAIIKKNGNFKFGKDDRFKDPGCTTPGPGQYKIPCSFRDINEYNAVGGKFEQNYKFI